MYSDINVRVSFDIPAPPKRRGRRPVYDFASLDIGGSFVTHAPRERVSPAAAMWGKRYGRRFSVTADGPGLMRVTRVS